MARKSAAISEEDLNAMRTEFEARLGATERKVYALTKERDALRQKANKVDGHNELVREKDEIIRQARTLGPCSLIDFESHTTLIPAHTA